MFCVPCEARPVDSTSGQIDSLGSYGAIIGQMNTDKPPAEDTELTEQHLRELIAEYESKLAQITELVAHVRHEINNPLTGVIGQAQLLLREDLSEKARRRVETIEQLAGRIRDTVAQLRSVQRTQNQALVKEREEAPPRH